MLKREDGRLAAIIRSGVTFDLAQPHTQLAMSHDSDRGKLEREGVVLRGG